MADPLLSLRELSDELGNPGIGPLWLAVKRKGVGVSKNQVEAFVKRKGERQIFQAVQPAKGNGVRKFKRKMDGGSYNVLQSTCGGWGRDHALHPCLYQRVRSLPVRRTDQE